MTEPRSRDTRWGEPLRDPPDWGKEPSVSSDKLMKPYLVRDISAEDHRVLYEAQTDKEQFELTRSLLSEGFWPTNVLTIGNKEFFVGPVIGTGNAVKPFSAGYLVMFYKDPATRRLMPRLIYHSLSDRSWRSIPGVYGTISKGTGIHYTQETKAHKNISRYIEQSIANANVTHPPSGKAVDDRFTPGIRGGIQAEWYTFDKEISRYDDKGVLKQFQKYRPGYLSSSDVGKDVNLSEEFRNFDFSTPELKAFVPDFTKAPVEIDILKHAFYGEVILETYTAQLNGRPIEWVMAYDKEGRVWIDRIAFLDREVNSYGVMPEVIDSGCLTNKPFDYNIHVGALRQGEERLVQDRDYSDITPLLDNLRPVQEYRKARNIKLENKG